MRLGRGELEEGDRGNGQGNSFHFEDRDVQSIFGGA